jgi:hypothetical protein
MRLGSRTKNQFSVEEQVVDLSIFSHLFLAIFLLWHYRTFLYCLDEKDYSWHIASQEGIDTLLNHDEET